MIIDKICNVSNYDVIPEFVKEFIVNINSDINEGRYELPNGCFANVESYTTKNIGAAKFEAHRDYIDIQLLVSGKEHIFYTYLDNLTEEAPYDKTRDIVFYKDDVNHEDYVTLNGINFAMIFPHEAHAPQVSISDAEVVKKVVVKVKM